MIDLKTAIKDRSFYNADYAQLRAFYNGNVAELAGTIFPKPSNMTSSEYASLMAYFNLVNLIKPSVNRLLSSVYSQVSRSIEPGSPYKDDVDNFLKPNNGYSLKAKTWFKSAILHGTGVIIFAIKDNQVTSYVPNIINTEIYVDDFDNSNIVTVIEQIEVDGNKYYRVTDTDAWYLADNAGNIVADSYVSHGLGICPAVVAYGESELEYGEIYGRSLVEAGVQSSIVLSRLNLALLESCKSYLNPKAVLKGSVNNENKDEAFDPDAILEIEKDGDFLFAAPSTNFRDLSDVIDKQKRDYSISSSIPLDALDPSNQPENLSATAAALRFGGLSTTVSRLVEEQKINEIKALTIVGALYQYIYTQRPVTFSDFANRFSPVVTMIPTNVATGLSEEVASWKIMVEIGAKTPTDLIKHFNPELSEDEINRRADLVKLDNENADTLLINDNNADTKYLHKPLAAGEMPQSLGIGL